MRTDIASHLSDTELLTETPRLARCERGATALLITHLAEVEARKLYLVAGCTSMFVYCTEVLRLYEHEALNRIEAARAARRFPRLLEMLTEGALNLTTLRLLAPNLTEQNREELLEEAGGKSKREVQELLARHSPRPDVRESVRKLPTLRTAAAAPDAGTVSQAAGVIAAVGGPALPEPLPPPSAQLRRPVVTPLAPDRYQITFTGSGETREMLELAKDMLRHAVPNADTAEVMNRALRVLLEGLARKKFAATKQPRRNPGGARSAENSRYLPASLKRTVRIRDRGRCGFIAPSGRRCNERSFVEFHHVVPYAKGGKATVGNIALRCRAHNGYEADLEFGERRPGGEWNVSEPRAAYGDRSRTRSGTRGSRGGARARVSCHRAAVPAAWVQLRPREIVMCPTAAALRAGARPPSARAATMRRG
jgi:hypothetical protein